MPREKCEANPKSARLKCCGGTETFFQGAASYEIFVFVGQKSMLAKRSVLPLSSRELQWRDFSVPPLNIKVMVQHSGIFSSPDVSLFYVHKRCCYAEPQ